MFGLGKKEDPELAEARKLAKQANVTTAEYGIFARELIAEGISSGTIPRGTDKDVIRETIADYEQRIEKKVHRQIFDYLDTAGRTRQLDLVLDSDIPASAYFSAVIPNYRQFLLDACQRAKAEIKSGK